MSWVKLCHFLAPNVNICPFNIYSQFCNLSSAKINFCSFSASAFCLITRARFSKNFNVVQKSTKQLIAHFVVCIILSRYFVVHSVHDFPYSTFLPQQRIWTTSPRVSCRKWKIIKIIHYKHFPLTWAPARLRGSSRKIINLFWSSHENAGNFILRHFPFRGTGKHHCRKSHKNVSLSFLLAFLPSFFRGMSYNDVDWFLTCSFSHSFKITFRVSG